MKRTKESIADILNFESNEKQLKQQLNASNMDWDWLVKASSQLEVMTSVYCRLKQKKLTAYLPKELNRYFESITEINRNRNQTLLQQTKEISRLLTKHKINHVFVKGIALLAMGCYKDLGERLIGDIDIIVDTAQVYKAEQLLIESHYIPANLSLFGKHKKHRHLPRLKHPKRLAAVEIHSRALRKKNQSLLKSNAILDNHKIINSIRVPENKAVVDILVLNNQINDFGYLYKSVNFKSCYDSLVIEQYLDTRIDRNTSKYHRLFCELKDLYFNPDSRPKGLVDRIRKRLYKQLNKSTGLRRFYSRLINSRLKVSAFIKGLTLFINNNDFRRDVINNKAEALNQLKSKL